MDVFGVDGVLRLSADMSTPRVRVEGVKVYGMASELFRQRLEEFVSGLIWVITCRGKLLT